MVASQTQTRVDLTKLFWMILLVIGCLSSTLIQAAVSARLSEQNIDELESVVLTIRASDTRQTETLDLSPLETDFDVLGTNVSSQYRFTNGREQSWVDYQITLQPKRIGDLTIPSITVGRDQSPSISLSVRKLSQSLRNEIADMVFFESALSHESSYVQAEVILSRRLFYSQGVQLYSDLPGPPELDDAVVLTLGETTSTKVTRDGRPYGVIEQRYAIFPEVSGRFTIPTVAITASVRLVEGGRASRKGVRVATETLDIEVRPVPASYPSGQPWLPATAVSVLQKLDVQDPINVGDTLTHEFLVHIIGNVGSVAPPQPLELEQAAFRTYPQSPVINDDTNGDHVVGARLQTTSIVPLTPGSLTIPAQVLYWWNTSTDSLESATTETITFSATGTAITPNAQTQGAPNENNLTAPGANVENLESPAIETLLPDKEWFATFAPTLVVLSLLVAFSVFAFRTRGSISAWLTLLSKRSGKMDLTPLANARNNAEFYALLTSVLCQNHLGRAAETMATFEEHHPEVVEPLNRIRTDLYGGTQQLDAQLTNPDPSAVNVIVAATRAFLQRNQPKKHTQALPPLYPSESTQH